MLIQSTSSFITFIFTPRLFVIAVAEQTFRVIFFSRSLHSRILSYNITLSASYSFRNSFSAKRAASYSLVNSTRDFSFFPTILKTFKNVNNTLNNSIFTVITIPRKTCAPMMKYAKPIHMHVPNNC